MAAMAQGRARRWRRAGAVAVACLAAVAAACSVPPPRGTLPSGSPGADGPCGVERTDLWNPVDVRHADVLFEPTGDARPWSGGTCGDDERPVVLIAHGYLGTAPEVYQGLIDHLVGNGFVVVFPGYPVEYGPPHQYQVVDTGFELGVAASGRVDTSRVGVVGHSFGGGMTPWLVRRIDARGWGSDALWAVAMAPHYVLEVGTGPIDLPARTHLAVVNYDEDVVVDARIGIDLYRSATLDPAQKVHVMVHTDRTVDPPLFADHFGPISFEVAPNLSNLSTDRADRWSAWRTVDSTAGCAMDGRWCDTDLGDMGTWPDGRAVVRAEVSADPVDAGPVAIQECEFLLNPRPCP
jgi:hypothetical protein